MRIERGPGRPSGRRRGRSCLLLAAIGSAVIATACGSPHASTGPPPTRPHASTTIVQHPTTTSVPSTTTAPGRFIPATTPIFEFYSPSRNISCQITYVTVTSSTTGTLTNSVYCETLSPTRSVVMSTDGSLKTCDGPTCGSNAGLNTPTLAYGDSTGVGPFRCTSTVSAMVCTVTGGKGFSISTAGITPVGG